MSFRNYKDASSTVEQFYTEQHKMLTYEMACDLNDLFRTKSKQFYKVEELLKICDDVYDPSDPDTQSSQTEHAYQAALAALQKGFDEEYVVIGVIHDLGKALVRLMNFSMTYLVGDTYPLGCPFEVDKITLGESLRLNPDYENSTFNTGSGIYAPNCGFSSMVFTGHDEFIYISVCESDTCLPDWAKYVLRFHSFYPWHQENAYEKYADDRDIELLPCLHLFNQCDLYTKHSRCVSQSEKEEIDRIVRKYIPHGLKF